MKTNLAVVCFLLFSLGASAQPTYTQYFDGADTLEWNSLFVTIEADSTNIWQIGPPQKTWFNAAASVPNVLVTDTVSPYPPNNISRFHFDVPNDFGWIGVVAVQWKQKLDLDSAYDGGLVEYSTDDTTWVSVFNNPNVYAFYGFQPGNAVLLQDSTRAFSGTDTAWRDIWLCFHPSFFGFSDSVRLRFVLRSDSIDNPRDGWMIDNLSAHITIVHTVKKAAQTEYLRAFPSITNGIVNIEAQDIDAFHVIESIDVLRPDGRLVKSYGHAPVRYWVDLSDCTDGLYFLRVNTNVSSRTFPILLQR
ncbi:MAG TPA: hypothetical protein VEY71_12435 [Chitinophagales bacterium]|nr:hypothetical protein [Chitinophagales bacterium]